MRSRRNGIGVVVAVLLAVGCAPKQVVQEPEIPVFRYEQLVHNEGFRGKFASESKQVITITPDRKRTDDSFKWTGAILGRITREKRTAEIVRLDRDLIWQIDLNKKRYLEFPIQKLSAQLGVLQSDPNAETVYVEDCVQCVVKTAVKRPGVKKIVNGFEAEQVVLTWSADCKGKPEDGGGKTTFTLEVWLAPGVKLGPEAAAFDAAYAKKIGIDAAFFQALGEPLLKAFPSVKELAKMMRDLDGYAILNVLSVENDQYLKQAQEARKQAAAESSEPAPSSPTDLVTGFVGKKMKEREEAKQKEEDAKWGNVIWRVSWESRNFKSMALTASEFNLMNGLKRVDQKEYLEGEQGGAVIEAKPAKFVRTT
jgi:hypothetical protein